MWVKFKTKKRLSNTAYPILSYKSSNQVQLPSENKNGSLIDIFNANIVRYIHNVNFVIKKNMNNCYNSIHKLNNNGKSPHK